jgi:hypothetical protein
MFCQQKYLILSRGFAQESHPAQIIADLHKKSIVQQRSLKCMFKILRNDGVRVGRSFNNVKDAEAAMAEVQAATNHMPFTYSVVPEDHPETGPEILIERTVGTDDHGRKTTTLKQVPNPYFQRR